MSKQPSGGRKKTTSVVSNDSKPLIDLLQQDNLDSTLVTVAVVELEELTEEEERLRLHLEHKVERAFYEAGKALGELRNQRLYRSTHHTFENYCRDRFGFERRHPYRLIEAATIIDNLISMCPTGTSKEVKSNVQQMCPNGTQILPTSERQVRPLAKLEKEQQYEAWQLSVQEVDGKVPPSRIVKDVVQRIMERTKIPNTYQMGEVCQIIAQDNPELRGKGGCWCIVSAVNDFSCTVRTWDGEHTVGLKHLKSYNYLPEECQQMHSLSHRINQIYSNLQDDTAKRLLESLGKVTRPYLTRLEEKLLLVVESEIREKT